MLPFVQLLGLNCGAESSREDHSGMAYAIEGTRQTGAALAAHGCADMKLVAYPNAGLPNAFGEYDELPPDTAQLLRDFALTENHDIMPQSKSFWEKIKGSMGCLL